MDIPEKPEGKPEAETPDPVKRTIVEKVRSGDFRSAIFTGLDHLRENPKRTKIAYTTGWAYEQYAHQKNAAGDFAEAAPALEEAEGRYRQALAANPNYEPPAKHLNNIAQQKFCAEEESKALTDSDAHPDNAAKYLYYIQLLLLQNKFLTAFKSISDRHIEGPMRTSRDIIVAFTGTEVMKNTEIPEAERKHARIAAGQAANRLAFTRKYDYLLGCLKERGLNITARPIAPCDDPTHNSNDNLIKHIGRIAGEAVMPRSRYEAGDPGDMGLSF